MLKTYSKKLLLLKGEALIGKTHLFCEIAKERLKNKKPTILFFGHQFKEDKSIVRNMIDLLDIDIKKDETFLESLNNMGKKYNSRVLIMIDAVNETKGNFWQDKIKNFSEDIQKYEYLALALSIRDVEEYKLIDSSNESFIKENFEMIEHKGITLTLKDIEKICKCLGIEIINIPTHMFNLFVNPGIMWIYLENIQKTSKKVNIKDVISPLDLFESIFNSLSERFNNRYLNVGSSKVLFYTFKEIIKFGISNNFQFSIEKEEITMNVKRVDLIDKILNFLISEGILREENEKIYFRYQKFENYFVMKYLLETREEKEILEKLLKTNNEALLEAFVLLLPLKGVEIFDLDENLLQNEKIVKYFIDSLIWRNKELIKKTTKKYLNRFIFNEFYKDEIFEMILHSSLIPNHPFNAEFLHTILKDLSIVKRDYIWSLFIHNSFENEKNVKRIIEWVLDLEDEKLIFEKEIATFYGITLSWFFTSSNRKLRDLATKALVKIFVNNLEIIPDILDKFRSVNDLYVLERILAAIYGAVLIVEENENFYSIAKKIFEIIFKDKVIEHIMIRDYAYLTIDFISKKIKLNFDISKIYPPYDSNLPDDFSEFEKFEEKLKNKFKFSYNKSLGKINIFIENIFFKTLANFVLVEKNEKIFSIYSYYTKDYFKKLMQIKENLKSKFIESFFNLINEDDVYLYLLIDEEQTRLRKEKAKARNKYYQDRLRYWIDNSITIKYKWIVFYKLLSIIADNFKIFRNEIERLDYKGSWQIGIRDIDPTYLNCKNKKNFQIDVKIDFLENKSNEEWIRYKKDLSFIEDILVYKNNIVLETFFSEGKIINIDNKFFPRKIEINVKSFFVENKNLDNFLKHVENDIEEINNLIINLKRKYEQQIYLREYFSSKVFEEISREQLLFKLNFLNKISNGILSTSLFFYETRLFNDYSFERETSDFILPSEWLIEKMNLVRKKENIWLNRENKIVCKSYNNALIMRKNIFMNFLDKNNLNLVWMFYINKKFLKSEDYHLIDYSEENRIYGLAYFKNNKLIIKGF